MSKKKSFKVRKSSFLSYIVIILLSILPLLSCGKSEPSKPLKTNQVYGLDSHLPSRGIISYQPDSSWVVLISPSLKSLIQTFFKIDSILKGEITKGIKMDPILSKIISDDVNATSENLKSFGIETEGPAGFFYNIFTEKWEIVANFTDREKLLGIFPSVKKSYLKTSWHSFITRRHPVFIDTLTNVGVYFSENGKVLISNELDAITKSITPKANPPSFNYGIEKKGIINENEVAILFNSTGELLNNIQEIKSSEIKSLLIALNSFCEDFGIVINPGEEKTKVACVFYSKNTITPPSFTPQTTNLISKEAPVLEGFLYLPKGLVEFLDSLQKNDKGGFFRKTLGPAMGALSHRLICDELSFGVYEKEGKIRDFIVATRSENVMTLVNLLKMIAQDSEPIGSFSTMKPAKNSPIGDKIPVDFVIGYKEPFFVITSSTELLSKAENPMDIPATGGDSSLDDCTLGHIKADKEKLSKAIETLKINLDVASILKNILPKLSDICINFNGNWGIITLDIES